MTATTPDLAAALAARAGNVFALPPGSETRIEPIGPVVRQFLTVCRSPDFGAWIGDVDSDWYRDRRMTFLPGRGELVELWPGQLPGGPVEGCSALGWPVRTRIWASTGHVSLELAAMRVEPNEAALDAIRAQPGVEQPWWPYLCSGSSCDVEEHLTLGGWHRLTPALSPRHGRSARGS